MTITPESRTSEGVERSTDLVPARMLNEFTYCSRLGYMEWVQGEFADSADTVDGRFQHRRVDKESGPLPDPGSNDGEQEPVHARSVTLSDDEIGAVARIDLLRAQAIESRLWTTNGGRRPTSPKARGSRRGFNCASRDFSSGPTDTKQTTESYTLWHPDPGSSYPSMTRLSLAHWNYLRRRDRRQSPDRSRRHWWTAPSAPAAHLWASACRTK